MNDFTKEELKFISNTIDCYQSDGGLNMDEIPTCESAKEKIQSMINNYCEHGYKKTLDKSGMFFISICHKCNDQKPWSCFNE